VKRGAIQCGCTACVSSTRLTQIPKLGNRLVVVLVLDLLGFCADERADLPGNYFVSFV
jgi:hypothetical protein